MSLTGSPLQRSYGIRTLNPVPVDWLSGPFTGNSIEEAVAAANNAISPALRFRSLEVRIIVGPNTYKYWYYGGTANSDLVEFASTVVGTTGATGVTGERGERGETGPTGSFTGDFVSSLNGLTGDITIVAGSNVDVSVDGNLVTISASGGSSETTWQRSDPVTQTVGGVAFGATFSSNTNAIEVLHKIFYPYQSVFFNSFNPGLPIGSPGTVVDLGTTSNSASYFAFWSESSPLQNWVNSSISIYRVFPSFSLLASNLQIGDSPTIVSHETYRYTTPNYVQFRIEGQQQQGINPTTDAFYLWRARVYWGKSTADALNPSYSNYSTFSSLFSGFASVFTASNNVIGQQTIFFPSTPGSDQYLWLFSPNSTVDPAFLPFNNFIDPANNLETPPSLTGTIQIPNANNLPLGYTYYRWQFPTSGAQSFVVRRV